MGVLAGGEGQEERSSPLLFLLSTILQVPQPRGPTN